MKLLLESSEWSMSSLPTETDFNVKTKYIVADFSKGQPIYQRIENELAGIPVGILGMYDQTKRCMVK